MLVNTGERFHPEQLGDNALEHVQRYLWARQFLFPGAQVLDCASGEGYGTAMLAPFCGRIDGVDISQEAVDHASKRYAGPNRNFFCCSAEHLGAADGMYDVVTSFETIEHCQDPGKALDEFRRVLKPGGILVMSSPDRVEYSEKPGYKNPFHTYEYTAAEFAAELRKRWKHVHIYGQRCSYGCLIHPLDVNGADIEALTLTHGNAINHGEGYVHPPMYLLAVASDADVPVINPGYHVP